MTLGIVKRQETVNRVYYEINRDSPLFKPLRNILAPIPLNAENREGQGYPLGLEAIAQILLLQPSPGHRTNPFEDMKFNFHQIRIFN